MARPRAAHKPSELTLSRTTASLPFPSKTPAGSNSTNVYSAFESYILANWFSNKLSLGADTLAFVPDPFVAAPPATKVLRVTYGAGSFGANGGTSHGGALFSSQALNASEGAAPTSTGLGTYFVSYAVAFADGFDFVKGGKLPGLRGGTPSGCSGGVKSDGTACFTSRIVWRAGGVCERASFLVRVRGVDVRGADGDRA